VAEAFKQFFKLGCELGPPRFFDESPEGAPSEVRW
jgi:hypothetical protein